MLCKSRLKLRKFFRDVCAEPVESAPSKTHAGQVVPTLLQEAEPKVLDRNSWKIIRNNVK